MRFFKSGCDGENGKFLLKIAVEARNVGMWEAGWFYNGTGEEFIIFLVSLHSWQKRGNHPIL